MTDKDQATAPSMNRGDILYILFRHKGKIGLISLLTMLIAVGGWLVLKPPYQSEARLYIRYVVETRSPNPVGESDARVRLPDVRGDSIMQTELQILTSMDLAQQAAQAIGPNLILGKAAANGTPEGNVLRAAALIQKNLAAEVPKDSSVIRVAFQAPNREIVQPVLKELIDFYFKKHAEIHAVGAFDDFLTQETDQRRTAIAQTEDDLQKAKEKAGIVSLPDTEHSYSEQMARLQQDIFDTEAELAEQRASAAELANTLRTASPTSTTNAAAATNAPSVVGTDKADEYRRVCEEVGSLTRKEGELLQTYAASSSLVGYVRAQIEAKQQTRRAMEAANPGLVALAPVGSSGGPADAAESGRVALNSELARVSGLESKLQMLHRQINEVRSNANALVQQEGAITGLQRKLALQETNYARFSQSLEQSRLDEKLGAGKVSNISIIQAPTGAVPAASKVQKILALLLVAGMGAAFGLPFVLELYVDRSVKRPAEVAGRLGMPLMLSIPLLNGEQNRRQLEGGRVPLLEAGGEPVRDPATSESVEAQGGSTNGAEVSGHAHPEISPWHPAHPLRPFAEALRDRLMAYFEMKQMTHKPKLVAVTSCGAGAGVSTIAAGLAASLSETGDGNVLLVDMNLENGGAAQFRQGSLSCGLDEALEAGLREQALVQDKLYMVSEGGNGARLPAAMPRRFRNLVPRLKSSDYDYIIFDMPPVTQVSITTRLGRFMDMVLLVLESEETNIDAARQAGELLAGAGGSVGAVLNKRKTYVPRALLDEL